MTLQPSILAGMMFKKNPNLYYINDLNIGPKRIFLNFWPSVLNQLKPKFNKVKVSNMNTLFVHFNTSFQ